MDSGKDMPRRLIKTINKEPDLICAGQQIHLQIAMSSP